MRTVSATALEAILSQQTDQVLLTILEITHPDLASPLRFVNDKVQLIHDGDTYLPAPFEFRLPTDQEDNVPKGQVVMDNIDRQIIEAVRPLKVAPDMEFNIVLADSPDTVEVGPIEFKLQEFSYDAYTIRGSLSYEQDFLNESCPKDIFSARTAKGLF